MMVIHNGEGEIITAILGGVRYTPAGLLAIIAEHADGCALANALAAAEVARRQAAEAEVATLRAHLVTLEAALLAVKGMGTG